MEQPLKGFITLEEIIKGVLRDTWESNTALYQRYLSWSVDALNDLQYSVLRKFKRTFLGIDTATMTAKLPDDFVQYTQVGLQTTNKEFVPLVYNSSIIINPTIPTCDAISDHCDCGCNDELCYAFGESNVVTTTENVIINGHTYPKTTTVCTESDGTIIQRICQPTVNNPTQNCTYTITFVRVGSELQLNPYTNFYFTKNNVQVFVGDIANSAALTTVMAANGFNLVSSGATSIVYAITASTDVWESATFTNTNNAVQTVSFVQSVCVTPTPVVETYCYEEKLCDVEVLECGCIKVNDTALNVLSNCCVFAIAVSARMCKNKNFGHTFAEPNGYFGEFNIDTYERILQVNTDYQYDTVYMEYYSTSEVDSKNYLVPIQAKETVIAWVYWKSIQRKMGVTAIEKREAKHEYYNQKRILKQLLHPLNFDELFAVQRMLPRP